MTLKELMKMSRVYARDDDGIMWSDDVVKMFVNQGIDRIKQFKLFNGEQYLEEDDDTPIFLPREYHYLLALFCSSRLYDIDERFFEGTQKRNEFEQTFEELLSEINNGSIVIDNASKENIPSYSEYVVDTYYGGTSTESDE